MIAHLRRYLRPLLPPIIGNFLSPATKKPITYEGVFNSFNDVLKTYPSEINYDSDGSLIEAKNRALREVNNFQNGHPPNYSGELIRLNLLSILSSLYTKQEINFLDIGGGIGSSYLNLMYSCPTKKINFTKFELPQRVDVAQEIFKDFENINFSVIFPVDDVNKFDIIYLGSSLQYFSEYQEIIDQICKLQPELIFISDTAFGPASTFVCAQVNMINRTIPRWIFNLSEIIEVMKMSSYQIVHKSVNYDSFHDFSNYVGEESETRSYNLVFRKFP